MIGGTVAFSGAAREAIADFLGVGGIRIFIGEDDTTPRPRPIGGSLFLGEELTLEAASARVGFDILQPDPTTIGPPDAVYLDESTPGGRVSLVYEATDRLPEAAETGVGVLVTQFPGEIVDDFYAKKLVHSGARLRFVEVAGTPGYWLFGAPHVYVDAAGVQREDGVRLAANVLLWERGDITLRIESRLPLARVLEIAESLR